MTPTELRQFFVRAELKLPDFTLEGSSLSDWHEDSKYEAFGPLTFSFTIQGARVSGMLTSHRATEDKPQPYPYYMFMNDLCNLIPALNQMKAN